MKKLEDYLIEDSNKIIEFDDEKINANLYLVTLVKSLREIQSFKKSGSDCSKFEIDNQWLYKECERIREIPTISFDQLKLKINAAYKSCDCFFYNAEKSNDKFSLLVEFKNVNRSEILKYLNSKESDSLYEKVKDSINMIKHDIQFEDGFSGMELVEHTHCVIVYGERADTVAEINLGFGSKNPAKKDEKGRQIRAVSINRNLGISSSKKTEEEILKAFGEKIQNLKLASCPKRYFGIPIYDPDLVKLKGIGDLFYYTMFTKHDFVKLIEEIEYFDNWDWGKYSTYFSA